MKWSSDILCPEDQTAISNGAETDSMAQHFLLTPKVETARF